MQRRRTLETACPEAALRIYETASNNVSNDLTSYESFEPQLSYLPVPALCLNCRFSPTRTYMEAAGEGASRKIRYGTGVHLPAGKFAADDFAFRAVY
jgi:hypothetical protein